MFSPFEFRKDKLYLMLQHIDEEELEWAFFFAVSGISVPNGVYLVLSGKCRA